MHDGTTKKLTSVNFQICESATNSLDLIKTITSPKSVFPHMKFEKIMSENLVIQ